MKLSRRAIVVIGVGVALLVVFSAVLLLNINRSPSSGFLPPINQVLWMHPETPGSSGNTDWYNITLTVNRSVPLADFIFLFINRQRVSELPPPTFTLTLMNASVPNGEYNFTSENWTSAAPEGLVSGDWFDIQVTNQDLIGDQLAVGGQVNFVGMASVVFP